MQCQTIEEVLNELDSIIASSVRDNNFMGIFAYVYRRTTAQIKAEVEKSGFEDSARMQKLDVIFANFYLDAYQSYGNKGIVSKCWQTAFDASHENITIVQHIMLGMNAHINLDLGKAAALMMLDQDIRPLENDFMKVNDILASLVDEMQTKLSKVSPLMFLLDWAGGRTDENIINFSMTEARKQAWRSANDIHALKGKEGIDKVNEIDQVVNLISDGIWRPDSGLIRRALKIIRYSEVKKVNRIIQGLES